MDSSSPRSASQQQHHNGRRSSSHHLGIGESLRLAALLGLFALEKAFRTILTLSYSLFPFKCVLDYLYHQARFLQLAFSKRFEGPSQPDLYATTPELLARMGLGCTEVECQTSDGFVLRLHRLKSRHGVPPAEQHPRPAVLLMHGLMMSSEIFVFSERVSLAAWLFRHGFDVWLGNSRGNKYSWQHRAYVRSCDEYWDFCIDDMAAFDVPALEEAVASATKQDKIGYIGFSNGTAQMFAALASGRAKRVGSFIALAPACRIKDLNPELVSLKWLYPLLGSSPRFFSALFGRQAFLAVTLHWQRVLSPQLFTAAILFCLRGLFSWDCANLQEPLRTKLFAHLYSTCSAKTVHQWFRMLKRGSFEPYEPQADLTICVQPYRMEAISTPVTLIYGGRDKLSDVQWLKEGIPHCNAHMVSDFEHLDFLACDKVENEMFPIILETLRAELLTAREIEDADESLAAESTVEPAPPHSRDCLSSNRKAVCPGLIL